MALSARVWLQPPSNCMYAHHMDAILSLTNLAAWSCLRLPNAKHSWPSRMVCLCTQYRLIHHLCVGMFYYHTDNSGRFSHDLFEDKSFAHRQYFLFAETTYKKKTYIRHSNCYFSDQSEFYIKMICCWKKVLLSFILYIILFDNQTEKELPRNIYQIYHFTIRRQDCFALIYNFSDQSGFHHQKILLLWEDIAFINSLYITLLQSTRKGTS